MVRQKMKEIPASVKENIFQRPDFLNQLPSKEGRAKEGRGMNIALLAEKLKNCNNDECVIYTADEFSKKFVLAGKTMKYILNYVKNDLKKRYKMDKVRHYIDDKDGRVYFWQNKLHTL